jgi:hypothetical protein
VPGPRSGEVSQTPRAHKLKRAPVAVAITDYFRVKALRETHYGMRPLVFVWFCRLFPTVQLNREHILHVVALASELLAATQVVKQPPLKLCHASKTSNHFNSSPSAKSGLDRCYSAVFCRRGRPHRAPHLIAGIKPGEGQCL